MVSKTKTELVEWVPKQYTQPEIHDYREAKMGPKGYKVNPVKSRKRSREEVAKEVGDVEEVQAGMEVDEEAQETSGKRQKGTDGVKLIPVSGRTWKVPGSRASQTMKVSGSSWEKKMKDRAERQQFLGHKKEAVTAAKDKRKAAAEQRKAAEARKKINRAKSEVTQKITNAATVKKMMKNRKQKKLLRTADTN